MSYRTNHLLTDSSRIKRSITLYMCHAGCLGIQKNSRNSVSLVFFSCCLKWDWSCHWIDWRYEIFLLYQAIMSIAFSALTGLQDNFSLMLFSPAKASCVRLQALKFHMTLQFPPSRRDHIPFHMVQIKGNANLQDCMNDIRLLTEGSWLANTWSILCVCLSHRGIWYQHFPPL